jgi:hypothetical protein
MVRTMSPGRLALPLGMFSAAATMPTTLIGSPSRTTACITPNTEAAPHMSNFISSMPGPGLMLMPPVSKVMPLPTSTLGLRDFAAPVYSMTISLAGCSVPAVTDRKAPMPMERIWRSSTMRTFMRSFSRPILRASSAR